MPGGVSRANILGMQSFVSLISEISKPCSSQPPPVDSWPLLFAEELVAMMPKQPMRIAREIKATKRFVLKTFRASHRPAFLGATTLQLHPLP